MIIKIIKRKQNLSNKNRKNIIESKICKLIIILILYFFVDLILLFEYYYKIERHSEDIFLPHRVFIESHRGINREIFQNTLESFSKAILYNIEAIETDVWLTKDKELVIVHGERYTGEIKELYNHKGSVKNLTWDQLSKFRTKIDNLKMPKLRQVFDLAKKNKLFINLEIKDPRVNETFPYIIKLIEEYDFFDKISLSSFYHDYFYKVQEFNKKNKKRIIFGNLYNPGNKNYDFTKKGHILNLYWTNINKEVCDKAHENGMAVMAWFFMSDKESYAIYEGLIEKGVDIICCNDPLLAKSYRDNFYIKSKIGKLLYKFMLNIKNYFIKYLK